jgi:hypothetical protein
VSSKNCGLLQSIVNLPAAGSGTPRAPTPATSSRART